MLGLRIPAYVVSQVDTRDADLLQRAVIRVAVLPDILLGQGIEARQESRGLDAHEVVILAIAPGHLHRVLVREHSHLLQPLVRAPDDERDAITHRGLHGKYRLSGEAMPVHAAEMAQRRARDPAYRIRVDVLQQDVAVE